MQLQKNGQRDATLLTLKIEEDDYEAKDAGRLQKLEKARKEIFPKNCSQEPTLPKSSLYTSETDFGLQNCKIINLG